MNIKQLRVDTVKNIVTNVYIIYEENEAIVIDPGGEPEKIIQELENLNCNLKYIFLTHCHADHIGGISKLKEANGGELLVSVKDEKGLNNPLKNLSPFVGSKMKKLNADIVLKDGDNVFLKNNIFTVIETPGHTNGSICLYCESNKILFSGDTMFKDTYGRTDLPTGNYTEMKNSIDKLLKLPNEVMVYPGHGSPTTIGDERKNYE